MFWRKILNRLRTPKTGIGTYIVEVSLVILSILIAFQADRYNQNLKNNKKLNDYIQATYKELLEEQETNKVNLIDCNKDIQNIQNSLRLLKAENKDSTILTLELVAEVFSRGVFRSFPPTTFDIMVSTGDVTLIKDLEFRRALSSLFSFRENYIKGDLQEYDAELKVLLQQLSKYLNLSCIYEPDQLPFECIKKLEGLESEISNHLFIFLDFAQSRAFHLRIAIKMYDSMIKRLEEEYGVRKKESTG